MSIFFLRCTWLLVVIEALTKHRNEWLSLADASTQIIVYFGNRLCKLCSLISKALILSQSIRWLAKQFLKSQVMAFLPAGALTKSQNLPRQLHLSIKTM